MISFQLGSVTAALMALLLAGGDGSRNREMVAGVTWLGSLVHIDPITGTSERVVTIAYRDVNCLAKNSEGRIFGIGVPRGSGGLKLFELNPYNGSTTPIRGAGVPIPMALAFAPDDVLYVVDVRGAVDSRLYRLELTNPPPDAHFVARMTDSTGVSIPVQGLTFSSDGTMYAWSSSRGLMKVNRNTGFCSDLDGTDIGGTDILSLAADSNGRIYGVRDRLYLFDLGTGAYSRVGSGEGFDVRGAEFYPASPPAGISAESALGIPSPLWSSWFPLGLPRISTFPVFCRNR